MASRRLSKRKSQAAEIDDDVVDDELLELEDDEPAQGGLKKKLAKKPGKRKQASEDEEDARQEDEDEEDARPERSAKKKTPAPKKSAPKKSVAAVAASPAAAPAAAPAPAAEVAPGRGSPQDCGKLFLQSFLGAPVKATAALSGLVERVNRFCGLHKPTATFVEEANATMSESGLDMAIKRVVHDATGAEFFVLCNLRADSVAQSCGSDLGKSDLELAEHVCEALARVGDGRLQMSEVFKSLSSENRIALQRLVDRGVLAFVGGTEENPEAVVLGVRALGELTGHLAATVGHAHAPCHFCKMPAFYRSTCSACDLVMHVYCEKKWTRPGQPLFCPGCKAAWRARDVERPKEIVGAKRKAAATSSTPKVEENVEAVEEEGSNEEEAPLIRKESSFIDILN